MRKRFLILCMVLDSLSENEINSLFDGLENFDSFMESVYNNVKDEFCDQTINILKQEVEEIKNFLNI